MPVYRRFSVDEILAGSTREMNAPITLCLGCTARCSAFWSPTSSAAASPEGERLPTETELAQRFGVSRGVARESLRSLEERGLVTVKHGSGATVRPSTEWDMFSPDVIAAMLGDAGGAKLLGDYLECRRVLEIEAAGLAAERATAGDLVACPAALEPDDGDGGRGGRAARRPRSASTTPTSRSTVP